MSWQFSNPKALLGSQLCSVLCFSPELRRSIAYMAHSSVLSLYSLFPATYEEPDKREQNECASDTADDTTSNRSDIGR